MSVKATPTTKYLAQCDVDKSAKTACLHLNKWNKNFSVVRGDRSVWTKCETKVLTILKILIKRIHQLVYLGHKPPRVCAQPSWGRQIQISFKYFDSFNQFEKVPLTITFSLETLGLKFILNSFRTNPTFARRLLSLRRIPCLFPIFTFISYFQWNLFSGLFGLGVTTSSADFF